MVGKLEDATLQGAQQTRPLTALTPHPHPTHNHTNTRDAFLGAGGHRWLFGLLAPTHHWNLSFVLSFFFFFNNLLNTSPNTFEEGRQQVYAAGHTCPTVLLDMTQMSAGFSMATMILAAISSFSQVFFRLKSGVPKEQTKDG